MNMFSAGKGAPKPAKVPAVRREIVHVPVTTTTGSTPSPGALPEQSQNRNRFRSGQRNGRHIPPAGTGISKTVERRALSLKRGLKRKQTTIPQSIFSDDEDEIDSSDLATSDSDASRKRLKSSVSSNDSVIGPKRRLICRTAFRSGDSNLPAFIHGANATSGQNAIKYKNPWNDTSFASVTLQYPSATTPGERFELKWPKNDGDDYRPMEDIIETIKQIVVHYFPDNLRQQYSDDSTGYGRRFTRAWQKQDIAEFLDVIKEFNNILKVIVEDGTVEAEISKKTHLSLEWVQRILDQIYSRTVSPKVESLRAYQNGSDNVYGELFPRFVSDIFKRTKLHHQQVFIDLGSGVGNVVLQAALEVGCESWGIEMMKNPCELAAMQAKEFAARTRLWGLNAGMVRLLEGDMTEHQEVPGILQRADVVLVNNQAFTPQLNDTLCAMFLDLKAGAQVVSLKPFVPEGHKIAVRNIDSVVNQFVQRKYEYFSDSVSWSYYGNAHWYIATKDLGPLNSFRRRMGFDEP